MTIKNEVILREHMTDEQTDRQTDRQMDKHIQISSLKYLQLEEKQCDYSRNK